MNGFCEEKDPERTFLSVRSHGKGGLAYTDGRYWLYILAAISPYEIRFECSWARWTCMDERYDTMVLDFYFEMMKKCHFFLS
jgi:hypothetical protein